MLSLCTNGLHEVPGLQGEYQRFNVYGNLNNEILICDTFWFVNYTIESVLPSCSISAKKSLFFMSNVQSCPVSYAFFMCYLKAIKEMNELS